MKFFIIDPRTFAFNAGEYRNLDDAAQSAGLDRLDVDHGAVPGEYDGYRYAIIVDQFGLFKQTGQSFFSIGPQIFAGPAVVYAYNADGETVDVGPWPSVCFFHRGAEAVERAIQSGKLVRPQIKFDDVVIWSWPEPAPDEFSFATTGGQPRE